MLIIAFITVILVFAGVGVHGYLQGILAPPYDPDKMLLNYERIGEGTKKIILLHGLTGSLNYWKRGLDDISDSCSLLLIDLLGFGESPKPNSKYDLEEHLGAIEKVIRKEGFDDGNTIVVGHSLGAILSLALTEKRPKWIEATVVIGLPVFKSREAIKGRFNEVSLWDGISIDSRYKFVCFFHPLYMTEWFRPDNIPKDVFKDARKHTWVSYYNTLDQVIFSTDLVQLASKIEQKRILFIHGEKDAAAPIENVEELIPLFSNAEFRRLLDADHQVFLAEPYSIWSLIKRFLIGVQDRHQAISNKSPE